MRIKPIIFSTPMVQAILEGRKTMTRRVIPELIDKDAWLVGRYRSLESPPGKRIMGEHFTFRHREDAGAFRNEHIPLRYSENDVLWVREKWRSVDFEYLDCMWSASIQYADGEKGPRVFWYDNSDVGIYDYCIYDKTGWRPSIHMPKEAARIFLRVTGVRVEKLQSITDEDGKREGVCGLCYDAETGEEKYDMTLFKVLWDGLNAKRGYGWDTNPWVWVYSYERVDKPAGWPGGEG
jgi:hypothetical protein